MQSYPEDRVKLGDLLECYGDFLTLRQKNLFTQYVDEDCSLSEIAQREGISPQAVSDALRHAQKTLTDMEAKLGMMHKTAQTRQMVSELKAKVCQWDLTDVQAQAMEETLDHLLKIWEE